MSSTGSIFLSGPMGWRTAMPRRIGLNRETAVCVFACALATAVFVLDTSLPLGVAAGVPYVAVVLLGWWIDRPGNIVTLGAISSLATVVAIPYSEPGVAVWMLLTNRVLALFAIWVTVVLLCRAKAGERNLKTAHDDLERRVDERTAALLTANRRLKCEIVERELAEESLVKILLEIESAKLAIEDQGRDNAELAERLAEAHATAKSANRAKSDFLANMSHELRTPLNAILGFSDMIKCETFGRVGHKKYREYAVDIFDSGKHLLDLINDILDLSKIESGAGELHEQDIDVHELFTGVAKLVAQRATANRVELVLDLPPHLPLLHADERKVKQILANLLSNAIKFTETGGQVVVEIWCGEEDGYAIRVRDSGIGIAPEDVAKSLAPFGQVDGALNRKHEGTGLGLPLVRSIIELHGGTLDLQSEPGAGTTVTVRFPGSRIVGR